MSVVPGRSTSRISSLLIFSVVALMLPLSFWRAVIFRTNELWNNFHWRDILKSSTLFSVLHHFQSGVINDKTQQTNILSVSEETHRTFYRRLIHEVVRIHRGNYGVPNTFPNSGSSRKTSFTETAEALQAFRAAQVHQINHKYLKSRKLLEHAFRLDPDNTDVLVALGEALEGSWRLTREFSSDRKKGTESSSLIQLSSSVGSGDDSLLLVADQMYTRALIVNPHLESAGNRKSRLMPLVEEIDQRRFNVIDSKVRRFYQIPDSNPGFRRAKIEQYFRHIYHSNAIEGNTLSLAQTRSILETRLAVGGKSLLEQNEVLGLDAALRFLNSTLLRGHHTTITLSTILELHRHVLSFVDPSEAGNLRHTQVFIADHNPPPPDAVLDLMNELVTWLNGDQLSDVHPIELAALTHWKLVYIHPFYDGNGRTARLLMNLILMRAGLPPAIIKLEDRQAYYEHLKTANEGDVRPFIRFIASCTERTIDEYLIAAEPHQIEPEVQRLPSEPSVVKLEPPEPYSLSWSAWPFALSSIPTHKPQPPSASRRPIRYAELVDPIELPQVIYLEG